MLALRQSSRNAPVVSALLSDSHRDPARPLLLSSRRRPGSKLTLFCLGPGFRREDIFFDSRSGHWSRGPIRGAEQRSKRGGCPRGLSEWRAQTQPFVPISIRATSSAAARGCEQRREPEGRRTWGRLFFGYFLLAKQKKVPCRRATPGYSGQTCDVGNPLRLRRLRNPQHNQASDA